MSLAYYNEIDKNAAQWLRNLIVAGHIAPGYVDERSIEDVYPSDLRGFTQCHFFAGIGVWSHALRASGWADDRPVWTGSCPCQPFSSAGKGAGFDDERHLWPAFQHLIKECSPAIVFGEQVASKDSDPWIDLVHTDLEALGYAFGAVPFPSAGVGAPHIRDRLYWVADAKGERRDGRQDTTRATGRAGVKAGSAVVGLGDANNPRLEGFGCGHQTTGRRFGAIRSIAEAVEPCRLADHLLQQRPDGQPGIGLVDDAGGRLEGTAAASGLCDDLRPGPVNGFWRDADWLGCRDDKWRPVEPGTFPLVTGAAARVVRLRAYGNAINSQAAQAFIGAVMEAA
jgi:DNA (cytosine-5)-methyltransferase 1